MQMKVEPFFSHQISKENDVRRVGALHQARTTQGKKKEKNLTRGSRIRKSGKILCQILGTCVCVHFEDCTPRSYRISCDPPKVNYLWNEKVLKN